MSNQTLAVLVPLLPFLAAVVGLLTGGRAPGLARPLAVLPTALAAVLAAVLAAGQYGGAAVHAGTELTPTGNPQLPIQLALHVDGFAALVALLVGVVATAVQVYSTSYLRADPRYPSYAALVSLFTAAMYLVVYSDDLIVLLVGWEVMGVCSYFLIGHHWETHAARAAALKAFLTTKLGDVPFLIGIFVLASDTGTFQISTLTTRLTSSLSDGQLAHPTVVALLLLAGVVGKSAQFPLHAWLPSAMAGPTPVSALIHAATMVAAGVYVVARLLPVFAASATALLVLAATAGLTMVGAALCALAQDDVKRVLAYSTLSQLAYMAGALAVGDRGAAVFHLLAHGAFKALLFLAAGVLIHAAGTNSLAAMRRAADADASRRLPRLAARVPDAHWTMTIGLLALAALPPFSGFFSKEAVLAAAEHAAFQQESTAPVAAGWIVLVAGLLTALLTAAYATRLWLLAFRGAAAPARVSPAASAHGGPQASAPGATGLHASDEDPPGDEPNSLPTAVTSSTEPHPPREPLGTTVVLWVLAVPALALGLLFPLLPHWFDGGTLAPTLTTSVLATGVALVGVVVTYATWRHTSALLPKDPDPGRLLLGPLHRGAEAGFHLDALYRTLAVRPVRAGARLVRALDRDVVDGYVRGAGFGSRLLGAAVRRAQTGNLQTYLTVLLAGSVLLAVAAVVAATETAGA